MTLPTPPQCSIDAVGWSTHYRIVPSKYPPINVFEDLVDPALLDAVFYLESLTNERVREEVGDISLVPGDQRVTGPGSTPVMAAFTHTGYPSRFSDGAYGVYYAGRTQHTAIAETRYHRERFLRATHELPGDLDMRVYVGEIQLPVEDIRQKTYAVLHDPDDWTRSQSFGATRRKAHANGIVYNSVRDPGGECLAAFKPITVTNPVQGPHLAYHWDGECISAVYEKTRLV